MNKLLNIKWKRYIAYIIIGLFTIIMGSVSIFGRLPASSLYLYEQIAIAIILAVSLSLVVGFLGELSLGHAGFMCVGAYLGGKTAAILAETALGNGIITLLIALVVGGITAGICGFVVGLPALRLKGDYLAIVTLAFGEIVRTIFENTSEESFGGPSGLETPRYDKNYLFIIAFLIILLTIFVIQNLIRSKHGRAITAIRDNEIAAKATGINVTKYKLYGFVIAAVFAGFAGVLFSYSNYEIRSSNFDYNYSIEILVTVVLGGMGSINGSIIAAALTTFLNVKLANILSGDLAVLKDLIYALILIVIVVYNNAPALAMFRDKYNVRTIWAKITKNRFAHKDVDDSGRWDVVPTKIKMDAILSTDFVVNDESKPDKTEGEK
ncbi:MAG: branched-chain amino acid ABC transporter permease [Clostridia bacterium]|nr:branched-chain amino acid ABC transporter permease [Clostridia bacterium]